MNLTTNDNDDSNNDDHDNDNDNDENMIPVARTLLDLAPPGVCHHPIIIISR